MAKKIKVKGIDDVPSGTPIEPILEAPAVTQGIEKLDVGFNNWDLVTIAQKVNEIIDKLNQ